MARLEAKSFTEMAIRMTPKNFLSTNTTSSPSHFCNFFDKLLAIFCYGVLQLFISLLAICFNCIYSFFFLYLCAFCIFLNIFCILSCLIFC